MLRIGEVYYTRRIAFIAIGIILLVICPLMLCIVCGVYRYRQKQLKEDPHWQMTLPRSRAGSSRNLRVLNYDPEDDSDTDASTLKKSRSYDKVYRTNEPLPGKPQIDFPAKKWDLDMQDEDVTSSEGSDNRTSTKVAKDISYINQNNVAHATGEKPKQTGRRSLRSASGTELDQHQEGQREPEEDDDFDEADVHTGQIHPAGYHQPLSPEEADQLHQQQYSPTFSGVDSRTSAASSINYTPQSAAQNRFGGVPVLPSNTQYYNRPASGVPAATTTNATPLRVAPATTLTQDSGLPSPPPFTTSPTPSVQKSTEV